MWRPETVGFRNLFGEYVSTAVIGGRDGTQAVPYRYITV